MKFNKSKSTLAIYGIKDIKNSEYSIFFHDSNRSFFDKRRIKIYIQPERIAKIWYDKLPDNKASRLLKTKKLISVNSKF